MRPHNLIAAPIAVALLLGLPATNVRAQTPVMPPIWASTADLPNDVLGRISAGDRLIGERKYSAARKEYKAAADILEAEGTFPVVPRRRIAEAYYFEGNYQTAVYTLDRRAEAAAERGDTVTQVWALADAAWVLGQDCKEHVRGGAMMELDSRVSRLRVLLGSPYLPEETRQQITAKRCDGCHATEPDKKPVMTCYRPAKR